MAIYQTNFLGDGHLGLFGFATDRYCLISNRISDSQQNKISKHLGVEMLETSIFNFMLSGIMAAGNSNGAVVPYLVEDHEVKKINEHVKTAVVPDTFNAMGNLVVANDFGGIVSDVTSPESKKIIDSCLGIKTKQRTIAGLSEVGALCVATNKGFVASPDVSDTELKELEKIFKVSGGRASANMGSKSVGSCIIANSNGFLVGEKTTPIEMEYLTEALGFL